MDITKKTPEDIRDQAMMCKYADDCMNAFLKIVQQILNKYLITFKTGQKKTTSPYCQQLEFRKKRKIRTLWSMALEQPNLELSRRA